METAVFSAASLFHGADDSDDDRGMSIEATQPIPPHRLPLYVAHRVLLTAGAAFYAG